MESPVRKTIDQTFAAVAARDTEAVLDLLADDAIVTDPHYPVTRMVGKAAIADGLRWVFALMASMSFQITAYFESAGAERAAVEVRIAHVLKTGMRIAESQMFVFEMHGGRVTRIQAYSAHGPHGIPGMFLTLVRLGRLAKKRPRRSGGKRAG